MYQLLFRNWKVALLWAIGVSASVGAFFADGGRHEQMEAEIGMIREQRSHAAAPQASPSAEPQAAPAPAAAQAEAGSDEEEDAGWAQPRG